MLKCNWSFPSEIGFILKNSVEGAQAEAEVEPKFTPFTGIGRRLDGKPLKHQAPTVSSPAKGQESETTNGVKKTASTSESSSSPQTKGKLVFGSHANRASKEAQVPKQTKEEPAKKEEPKFQAFSGKKYSLKG
ncbi:putative ubiquitin fusion degradation protein 1 [Cocos nucifera]|nr:putative ubiquitin fusion degradation protein 1 [Cocos nucifera]